MREILTVFAIIVILALTTMLVGPYLIDWNSQRGWIESQLSRAVGQRVTIGGPIDLKLLPTPYLRLNQAVIGNDDGALKVGIRYLDLELAVGPLLHGEFDITESRLESPNLRLNLQGDRAIPMLPTAPALNATVRLERLRITDGTLSLSDPQSGRDLHLDHLDSVVEASDIAGPFRIAGTRGSAPDRTAFHGSLTAQKGHGRLRLAVDERQGHTGLTVDGEVALGRQSDGLHPTFKGTLALSGKVADVTDQMLSWDWSTPIDADAQRATLGPGELRVNNGSERSISLATTGSLAFADALAMDLHVTARQLDLDRLAKTDDKTEGITPLRLKSLAALGGTIPAGSAPIMTVDLTCPSVVWNGETLSGLSADLQTGTDSQIKSFKAEVHGPGGLALAIRKSGPPTGHTTIGLSASDSMAALTWIRSITTGNDLPASVPFHAAALDAVAERDGDGWKLNDVRLALDRTKLSGTIAYAPASHSHLMADLFSPHLDIDSLSDLSALASTEHDSHLKLAADLVSITSIDDQAPIAKSLSLDVQGDGRRLDVKHIAAQGIDGAAFSGKATLDPAAVTIAGSLDAEHLGGLAALTKQLAPSWATLLMPTDPDRFAPTHAIIDLSLRVDHGRLKPVTVDIASRLASTQASIKLKGETGKDEIKLDADIANPRSDALLAQLGYTAPLHDDRLASAGGHIVLAAQGPPGRPLATRVFASLDKAHATLDGTFDWLAPGRPGSGVLTLDGDWSAPLHRAEIVSSGPSALPIAIRTALTATPDDITLANINGRVGDDPTTGRLVWRFGETATLGGELHFDRLSLASLTAPILAPAAPTASGETWSRAPFATLPTKIPLIAVALKSDRFDIGPAVSTTDASMQLDVGPGRLALKSGTVKWHDGHLGFAMSIKRQGEQAYVDASISADEATIALPSLSGKFSGHLALVGSGTSPAGLVASLGGTGTLAAAALQVKGVEAQRPAQVFDLIEADKMTVDANGVQRAFAQGNGAIDAGSRRFAASAAAGVIDFAPLDPPFTSDRTQIALRGRIDMRSLTGTLSLHESLEGLPKDWRGAPPSLDATLDLFAADAKPRYDVATFTNALAGRAIARESARLDAFELELRERALFNARLKADQRREQDRQKAEADARAAADANRKADAERRAAAEVPRDPSTSVPAVIDPSFTQPGR